MIFQIDRSQGKRCRFQAVLRDCPASSAPSRATGDSLTPEWGFGMAQPSFGCVARESRAHSMAFIVRILPVFTGWQLAVRHFKSLPLVFCGKSRHSQFAPAKFILRQSIRWTRSRQISPFLIPIRLQRLRPRSRRAF